MIDRIEYLHEVLIITLFILLILLLKGDYNEIIVFELPDDLLLALNWMCLDLFSASVLINVFVVAFEADEDVAGSAHLH